MIQSEEEKEKTMKKSVGSLRVLWDITTQTNICIMEVPKGKERKEQKKAENFPNLGKEMDIQIQEAQKLFMGYSKSSG